MWKILCSVVCSQTQKCLNMICQLQVKLSFGLHWEKAQCPHTVSAEKTPPPSKKPQPPGESRETSLSQPGKMAQTKLLLSTELHFCYLSAK